MIQHLIKSEIKNENDIIWIRRKAKDLAQFLGFDLQDQTRLATAVSEIIRNAFQYAKGGMIEFSITKSQLNDFYFNVQVKDNGYGIKNLDEIENGTYVSPDGMGVGLMGAKKLMDYFTIDTSNKGTTISMGKVIPNRNDFLNSKDLGVFTNTWLSGMDSSPLDELKKQNREILETMTLLNTKTEELNRLNEELQDTNRGVVALYAELDEKAEFLRIASEAKTSFLSNMTHEFRSPLNSILGIAEIIKIDAINEKSDEREKQIGFIIKAANSLSELVNDLLDIAKIEAGKIKVKPSHVKVSDIISTLRGLMKPLVLDEEINVVIMDPEVDVTIVTDEGKLSQILRNLISNAIKYTEKGDVVVTFSMFSEDVVQFEVKDSGIGIAQENLELIFEEFVQLESSIHKKNKGTGLGLPLSKRLAKLLHGNIEVKSDINVGSIFTLKIPIRISEFEETREFLKMDQIPAVKSSQQPLVLIVDDDDSVRYSLSKILDDVDVNIKEARNVYEALYITKNFFPALIILDLVMPGKNGIDFINEIIETNKLRDIPIVLHTSKKLEEEEKKFLEQSTYKILAKEPGHKNVKQVVKELFSV